MKRNKKNETEEKMDLLDANTKNDIYKLQKKTKEEEDEKYNDLEIKYGKYRIEDFDLYSQSSNEDIETKMNKMIQIKKKGGNLQEYIHNKEMTRLQKMKLVSEKFQQQKDKKLIQKKEEKLMKLKKGLEKLELIYPILKRNINFRKFIKKSKYKSNIIYGFDIFKKFYNIRTKAIKKNISIIF